MLVCPCCRVWPVAALVQNWKKMDLLLHRQAQPACITTMHSDCLCARVHCHIACTVILAHVQTRIKQMSGCTWACVHGAADSC